MIEAPSELQIVDNVFVKMHTMHDYGQKIFGHAHKFDHITLLASGKVAMKAAGKTVEHTAPCLIVTPKGVVHEFECVSSKAVLCCIHAIRDGDEMDDVAPQDITRAEADALLEKFSLIESQ